MPTDKKVSLILVGAGGHAVSCAGVARAAGYQSLFFVDAQKAGSSLLGFPVIPGVADAYNEVTTDIIVAIGDNWARQRASEEVVKQFRNCQLPALVHPTASVSQFSQVGIGSVLMPGAIVGPNSRVGSFCILNTRASIDHDCVMEDFSSLAPAAVTGGNVHIGARSALSIGAVVKQGTRIGSDSVIGANSYVNKPVADNVVCYGTPAGFVRNRASGEPYLL